MTIEKLSYFVFFGFIITWGLMWIAAGFVDDMLAILKRLEKK